MLIVYFKTDLGTQGIADAIERIRKTIKEEYTLVGFVIIQPQAIPVEKK